MGVTVLASGGAAYVAGALAFDFGIPLIGLVCLIVGLWDRARSRRQPRPAYPYPPYPPYPPGPPGPPPMGYPSPYPRPPYPPPPYYPPYVAPTRRAGKSSTVLIIIGAVLLAFGILSNAVRVAGDMGRKSRTSVADTSIQVGECIPQKAYLARSFGSRPENDCADPANIDELVYKSDSRTTCPDGKREHSAYDWYADGSTILCFVMNLKQGKCYLVEGEIQSPRLSLSACYDDRPGMFTVVQRIEGSTDKTQCPTGTNAIAYTSPPRVYCLARAGT